MREGASPAGDLEGVVGGVSELEREHASGVERAASSNEHACKRRTRSIGLNVEAANRSVVGLGLAVRRRVSRSITQGHICRKSSIGGCVVVLRRRSTDRERSAPLWTPSSPLSSAAMINVGHRPCPSASHRATKCAERLAVGRML